ncbi:HAMP domain-containing sensor histidine kinase [Catellatospora sp. NPDC049609]|uniref:sensor histidine kinase n=1 Tax=Catellatospora sp. NPDC049609 TaxID=3155505 RepID=UPI003435F8B1
MTFRVRVFVLVALVALVATGASTYVTLTFAKSEVAQSAQAQEQTMRRIAEQITQYGRDHGTWERVADLATRLAQQTGHRIRLDVQDRPETIVDTAVLLQQPVEPMTDLSAPIDARTRFEPSRSYGAKTRLLATNSMELYRQETRFAACLTRYGFDPKAVDVADGVPVFAYPDVPKDIVRTCREGIASTPQSLELDLAEVERCRPLTGATPAAPTPAPAGSATAGADPVRSELGCLQEAFLSRISGIGPVPLRLAVASHEAAISATPIALAVGVVTVPILLGTLLLSRHVLRPIRGLTLAARRFGEGALDQRVTVAGGDELAQLAVTFNRMADSVQHGEEQQRRMVADVAHELRTPLANLRAYLEALEDGLVTADAALFRSLHEETLLQQRIVDDLQTLALAEAGRLVYHRSAVSLGDLLESCRTAHQPSATAAGVELDVTADPGLVVRADPDRLRQALGNLVTNAVRHSPAGTTITLAAVPAGQAVLLRVIDQGSGIAPADREHVFDRFWRADRARTRGSGGSGLGLSIARQIVLDHQGSISVASDVGHGTTFTIRLPVGEPAR